MNPYAFGKTIVVGLGGSVVFPDEINWQFIKNFRVLIKKQIKRFGRKFIIVVGGGKIARVYQQAAAKIVAVTNDDKDWLGIHATRANAHLLRTIFRDIADPVVIDNRKKIKRLKFPVTIGSGWRPGWSTDYVAMAIAANFKIPEIVIAGKPDHVYTKDPLKFPNAKPLENISWKECRRLIPRRWIPGASAPVDPVAAKLGDERKIAAIIIGASDLKNMANLLDGKESQGTIIR